MKAQVHENQIEASEADYLYKRVSQLPGAGYGLFTAVEIYKEEIIAIFNGEIISPSEANNRAKASQDQYFIMLLNGQTMDSKNVDCFAKYANDALGSPTLNFKNNAKITLDENDKVCIQATKRIIAGDEIFVSYGKRYWRKHSL